VTFTGADYQLTWPRHLFVAEASSLLSGPQASASDWEDRVGLVLDEALAGPAPKDDFIAATGDGVLPGGIDGQRQFLRALVGVADALGVASRPKPYWPDRQTGSRPPTVTREAAQRLFVRLVADFSDRGYLDKEFPAGCVDDRAFVPVNESDVLEERLGVPNLWPLDKSAPWDDDIWFGLVEVVHDLVARPRTRQWHDWDQCGWHYSDFAIEPARQLYQYRVNQLFERADVPLRMSTEGEDTGRLVGTTDEARDQLVNRLLTITEPLRADRIRHAIALFRSRGASDEDKRSAIIALAGVLEERRSLLKDELLRKDEGALFQIANQFAIRHQNAMQRADYDPAFLDWIFWWYAATVELLDRLTRRHE
jgi:hypothetical protein